MKIREYLDEGKKLTDRQVELIKAEIADGQSSRTSIASRYGVSVGHINDIAAGARRENIQSPVAPKKLPDIKIYGPKRDVLPGELTDQEVRDIRKSMSAGEKPANLSKKYGVSDIHIRDIGAGKRRKNVT